jgi:hypothetical protein
MLMNILSYLKLKKKKKWRPVCEQGLPILGFSFMFRSVDMATPLHHTWTYQALAHDVLQYSQNR